MLENAALDRQIRAEGQPPAQLLAFHFIAQERVDLVNQWPAIAAAGGVRPRRPAIMLGVDDVERELPGNSPQSRTTNPAGRGNVEHGRSFKILRPGPEPRRGPEPEIGDHHVYSPRLEGPQDLDRQHCRAVVLAGDRKRGDHQDAHRPWLHPSGCRRKGPSIVAHSPATRSPSAPIWRRINHADRLEAMALGLAESAA